MIDLHTHSNHSDGFLTPQELLNKALSINLEALALTDHDAITGSLELLSLSKNKNIHIVTGSELSVYYPNTDIEIIALNIPKKNLSQFKAHQDSEIKRRKELTLQRLEALQKLGYNITFEDIAYDDKGNLRTQVRRPHFADALLKKGYIPDTQTAYKTIFAKNSPAHIEDRPKDAKEIIEFIKDNKATAILAHPIHTKKSPKDLYNLISELKSYGLDGIEIFHSSQKKKERKLYLNIIKDLNLICSGGSDFHGGTAHPKNKLGTGKRRNLNIPYFVLEIICAKSKITNSYYNELEKYI